MMENLQLLHSYLQQNPLFFVFAVFLFSLCVGSFLNVVIYRLPIMMENAFAQEYQEYFNPKDEQPAKPVFNLAVPRSVGW